MVKYCTDNIFAILLRNIFNNDNKNENTAFNFKSCSSVGASHSTSEPRSHADWPLT